MAKSRLHPAIKPGDVFSRLTVRSEAEPRIGSGGKPARRWRCECECRNWKEVSEHSLLYGNTRSCGCLRTEELTRRHTVHGNSKKGRLTPEYVAWTGMKARCRNPKASHYDYYGGRGVTVCDRWLRGEGGRSGFQCFLDDMGPKPSPTHSLDRIDPESKQYGPGLCRWATVKDQRANRRNTIWVALDGERVCLSEAARRNGLDPKIAVGRRARGWPESEWLLPVPPKSRG